MVLGVWLACTALWVPSDAIIFPLQAQLLNRALIIPFSGKLWIPSILLEEEMAIYKEHEMLRNGLGLVLCYIQSLIFYSWVVPYRNHS